MEFLGYVEDLRSAEHVFNECVLTDWLNEGMKELLMN